MSVTKVKFYFTKLRIFLNSVRLLLFILDFLVGWMTKSHTKFMNDSLIHSELKYGLGKKP